MKFISITELDWPMSAQKNGTPCHTQRGGILRVCSIWRQRLLAHLFSRAWRSFSILTTVVVSCGHFGVSAESVFDWFGELPLSECLGCHLIMPPE